MPIISNMRTVIEKIILQHTSYSQDDIVSMSDSELSMIAGMVTNLLDKTGGDSSKAKREFIALMMVGLFCALIVRPVIIWIVVNCPF